MLAINHNLSALNVSNTLSGHYSRLQTSTQRLSSGLRINSAADDAAGLAIRELMRADIAALRQGIRNVNDGISMIQTMDGALGVIDEKLIRMKELAEQAATGTYNSDQRLMIDSEFQAMGDEIDRIARATDFNGIHLLYGEMITWTEDVTDFWIDNRGTVENLQPATGVHVAFNIDPAKYISANNPADKISISLTAVNNPKESNGILTKLGGTGNEFQFGLGDTEFKIALVDGVGNANIPNPTFSYAGGQWTSDTTTNANPPVTTTLDTRTSQDGSRVLGETPSGDIVRLSLSDKNGAVNVANMDPDIETMTINVGDGDNGTYYIKRTNIEVDTGTPNQTATYNAANKTININLKEKGGSVSIKLDNVLAEGDAINFDITMEGVFEARPVERHGVDPNAQVIIHFGPENDAAEDYYGIKYQNCTLEGLGLDGVRIETQDAAQKALGTINDAIVAKDNSRAYFGAMQNRLENTMSNLSIQAENLQAAESRISDTEIAQEMMEFVRNQILTNSAVAMLAQANNLPQMVLTLIR